MSPSIHRRPSILTHRPKTSSAVDDKQEALAFDMKRTASQTFTSEAHDGRDTPRARGLGSVDEGRTVLAYPSSQHSQHSHHSHHSHHSNHSHTSSLSRASQTVVGGCKYICRRLSTSSARRPSIAGLFDNHNHAPPARDKLGGLDVLLPSDRLVHQDSGMPSVQQDLSEPHGHSRFSVKRWGTIRHRRPATSGPSGDTARFNPGPPPVPTNYPIPPPGSAARAAAAAANNERLSLQRREQEQTARFLAGTLSMGTHEDDIKDNESGIGMNCSSPIQRTDSAEEKKFDPLKVLPAEISSMILSNLEAPSLIVAELVSKVWNAAANSPHVWRNVFLNKFEPRVHVNPTPIMMGGAGCGKIRNGRPVPGQDWKQMYKVRKTISRRWTGCSPSAIYLNGHTDSVYCCQFDENKIITGSRDRTIRVWDMKTYKCLKVIGGPTNRPVPNTPHRLEAHKETVVNHPSLNGTVEGNSIYCVPSDYHEASILCLQYDDEIMVTGSSDHTCIVWDITGDEYVPMYRLKGHSAGVLDVCLDDKHIISCSKDSSINVWDRVTGNHIRYLQGHRGPVNAVQLRGNLLVSASGDGIAKLWNLDSGMCVKEFPSQDRGLAAVEFSDDAKYVLAGGNDHVVYKFDALTGQLIHTSVRHGGLVRSLFLDAHNGRVISGSYDQSIRIADYASGEVFGLYENWTTSWILSAKSDYRRVVATSQDGRALILDFGWNVLGKDLLVGAKC
ncbi:F-box/WD repeat-containing protein lin-23 [Lindgomyces ingoldianus]|uniref:F-box/WD repeat-containing protein lin-23 n=1 Tax=Lindgomyces ingoldianus TaxID=673940 RepID=A0ACB6RE94_9PLEO|nr:F-box/WD repeat-containing protein lin-23 [Lindgomyces ingoldianus]KAF2477068.1 F-box/WD repeat-containing protein lin-23 [Lindgomyces ingoldianus]